MRNVYVNAHAYACIHACVSRESVSVVRILACEDRACYLCVSGACVCVCVCVNVKACPKLCLGDHMIQDALNDGGQPSNGVPLSQKAFRDDATVPIKLQNDRLQ